MGLQCIPQKGTTSPKLIVECIVETDQTRLMSLAELILRLGHRSSLENSITDISHNQLDYVKPRSFDILDSQMLTSFSTAKTMYFGQSKGLYLAIGKEINV